MPVSEDRPDEVRHRPLEEDRGVRCNAMCDDAYSSKILPTKTAQQCYLQTQRLLGQQSLAEFMGLHVDIDRIAEDNRRKQGIRKFGFLVNQGCKLTPQEKKTMIEENRLKYGLSEEVVEEIKLPAPCHLVQVYDIDKIWNPRLKLSTLEKLHHFIKLQDALTSKLEMLRSKKLIPHQVANVSKRGRPAKSSSMMTVVGSASSTGIYTPHAAGGKAADEEEVEEDDSEEEEEEERVRKQPRVLGQNRVMIAVVRPPKEAEKK